MRFSCVCIHFDIRIYIIDTDLYHCYGARNLLTIVHLSNVPNDRRNDAWLARIASAGDSSSFWHEGTATTAGWIERILLRGNDTAHKCIIVIINVDYYKSSSRVSSRIIINNLSSEICCISLLRWSEAKNYRARQTNRRSSQKSLSIEVKRSFVHNNLLFKDSSVNLSSISVVEFTCLTKFADI